MKLKFQARQARLRPAAAAGIAVTLALLLSACGANDQPAATAAKNVTIKRDKSGVPHIYADDKYGVFYGYGYSLAEDRMFQLEMAKRSFTGTTAQVLGAGANNANINYDISVHMNFDPDSIRAQIDALPQADKDIFQGYADGFNARVAEVLATPSLMSKQFNDYGFKPSTWTPFDVVMVWVGSMANRFADSNSEVANLDLLTNLKALKGDSIGKQIFDQVRWVKDPLSPTTAPADSAVTTAALVPKKRDQASRMLAAADRQRLDRHLARLAPISAAAAQQDRDLQTAKWGGIGPDFVPKASNLWIAGPSKTADGSTVLINGPQFGWFNPGYTSGVGLHGGGFDVVGSTPFGYPIILFATNGTIAWGATAGPLDVVDMYQEKLNPANQYQYLFNGSYRDMKKRTDTIEVKGAAPVTVDVYSTLHGLVTSFDAANNVAYAKKRSWVGLEVQSLIAWVNSMKAQNWDQFLAQAAQMGITINWYYADTSGNIGYVSPGKLPVRPASQDMRLPADGTGAMEWQGFRPFSANPQAYNPKQGYLANWNNRPSADTTNTDSNFWSKADRVTELNVQFDAKAKFTSDELWDFNRVGSYIDVNARYFKPFISSAVASLADNDPVKQAAMLVANWDGMQVDPDNSGNYNSPALTIMQAWLPAMYNRLLKADIPARNFASFAGTGYPSPTSPPGGSINVSMGSKVVYNALLGAASGVPQNFDFFHGADKDQMIRDALNDAVTQLTAKYGADMSKWLSPVATQLFRITNFTGTLQAGADEELSFKPYQNRGTQNDRIILNKSGVTMCDVAPPGQSGFISPAGTKSPHYQDQLDLYKNFGCKPQWTVSSDVDKNIESTRTISYTRSGA
jgi:penicillin amidase